MEKLKDMIDLNPNYQLTLKKSSGCFATNHFFASSRESTIRGRISCRASSRTEQTHQTTETHQVLGSQAIDCRILLVGSIAEKHQRWSTGFKSAPATTLTIDAVILQRNAPGQGQTTQPSAKQHHTPRRLPQWIAVFRSVETKPPGMAKCQQRR